MGAATISLNGIFDGQKMLGHNCYNNYDDINRLYRYLDSKGINLEKSLIYGPCMFHSVNGIAIDERLNTYNCAGFLYQKATEKINNEAEHIITSPEWYQAILNDSSCIDTCYYAPICYGGCQMNKTCKKKELDYFLHSTLMHKINNKNNQKNEVS